MSTTRLLDHFSALDDPRQSWKMTYPLPEVLLIVLCATMAGAEDYLPAIKDNWPALRTRGRTLLREPRG